MAGRYDGYVSSGARMSAHVITPREVAIYEQLSAVGPSDLQLRQAHIANSAELRVAYIPDHVRGGGSGKE